MLIKNRIICIRRKGGGGTETSPTIPEWARPYIENVAKASEGQYSSGNLDNVAGTNPLLQATAGSGAKAIADTTNTGIGASRGAMGVAGQGIGTLSDQSSRLTDLASSGGYDTGALKDKAILEAGQRTAQLGNQYGAGGTLGSARQAVQQGAQDAATAAQFATIDSEAAQRNFQNKMAAEGALSGNVQTQQGVAQAGLGAAQAGQGMAVGAEQAFSNVGAQQREIEQQHADAPWQALQRYASTIYGNPARQQTVASGGGK